MEQASEVSLATCLSVDYNKEYGYAEQITYSSHSYPWRSFFPPLPNSSSLFNRPDRLLRHISKLRQWWSNQIARYDAIFHLNQPSSHPRVQTLLLPHSWVTKTRRKCGVNVSSPVLWWSKWSCEAFAISGNFRITIAVVALQRALTSHKSYLM